MSRSIKTVFDRKKQPRLLSIKQWLLLMGLLVLALIWHYPNSNQLVLLPGQTMGTYYTVKYLQQPDLPPPNAIQSTIEHILVKINHQMSTYQADSDLSRFNQSRITNYPFALAPETLIVVREALRLHQITNGGLDITLGPLVNLWGFGPEDHPTRQRPSLSELAQRHSWVGMDKLLIDVKGLIKTVPELYIDLSAIAKGFGVDQVADYLETLGINHYLVDIGGEIRVRGNNDRQKPWQIAIETPVQEGKQSTQQMIRPGTMALATSGDYRNYFEQEGVRYSHTLDPRTGYPITHQMASITVLHRSCMTADGLATALNVLGPDKALALANQVQIPVFLIVKTIQGFEHRYSEAFRPYLVNQKTQ